MHALSKTTDRMSPMLDSSVLGRHLLAAEDAATVRGLLGAAGLPDDGTTDIGPLVQQAYDDGAAGLQLESGATYLWNSPVFLDRGGATSGFVIEANRARILLGGGLPTTNWSRDGATRFAVFPNTKRSALSGGAVTVSAATRATGPDAGAIRTLTIRDALIDGNATNCGFSFANQAGVTFEQVILWRARVGATWVGYSDGNSFLHCYSRAGGPAQQAMIEQVSAGDGLTVIGGKADTSVAFARLRGCRGGVIQGVVTARLELEECANVVVQGSHFEGQQSTLPMITLRNSQVVLQGCAVYATYDPAVGGIVIDDTASDLTCSELVLQDCTAMQLVTPAQRATTYSPLVILRATRAGTRVTARGLQGRTASSAAPGRWLDTVQPEIAAPGSKGLARALATPAARTALAAGDFELRCGTSGWQVRGTAGQVVSRRQGPPRVAVSGATGMRSAGTIAQGTRFAYLVAVQDAFGNFTKRSAVVSAAADAGGLIALTLTLSDPPGVLVVWRSGGDVVAQPDRYAVLPTRAGLVHLFDTGDRVAGRAWVTAGIPSPLRAVKNRTRDALLLGGTAVTR